MCVRKKNFHVSCTWYKSLAIPRLKSECLDLSIIMRNRSNSIFLWNKIVQILAECPSSQSKPPYCLMISIFLLVTFFSFPRHLQYILTEFKQKRYQKRAKNHGILMRISYANFFIFYYWFLFFFYSICSTYWQNSNIKGAKKSN